MKATALLFLLACAPFALADPPAWKVDVRSDPVDDSKSATVTAAETGGGDALERAEIGVLVGRSGYNVLVAAPGILLMDRVDAQMRFDDAPAETVPFAPAGGGMLMCLRRDEIVPKLLAAKRVVVRFAHSGGRQKTAIFDFAGFRAAWDDALAKVGAETVQAAAAASLKRSGWEVDGSTALRQARDLAWSSTDGASPVAVGVTAKEDGTAGLSVVCGVKVDAVAGARVKLRLRLDGGEWSEADFVVGGDGDLAFYPGDATPVVRRMTSASKLEIEIKPLFGKPFVAEIRLDGLAAALKRLKPKAK